MGNDAVVVGAGVGGLTAAIALGRQGWSVRVLERADALEDVGAGLAVGPNALRVLDLFGAGEAVRALAGLQGAGGVRGRDGRWLARTSVESVARRLGVPFVVARRSELVAILRDRLPAGALRLGRQVRALTPGDVGERATVETDAGTVEADLVVCADGIWSTGRRALFPGASAPRYAGAVAWRMVVPRTVDVRPAETWGPGGVFGLMPLTGGEVYCYATAAMPAGGHAGDEAALLRRLFGDWHHPIPELLATVGPADVLRNDVYDLPTPLTPFHAGRVALLGDAAHAMTPNLGQGACQAIEDAAVLAYHVGGDGAGVVAGLAAYTAARRPRTTALVRRSRSMMRTAQLSAPAAVLARDAGMAVARLLSADLTARLFFGVAGWRPPQEAVGAGT